MSVQVEYDVIQKYVIYAKLVQPLHVGSHMGDKREVLIDPITRHPFIQASSIAGAIRAFSEVRLGHEKTAELFGSHDSVSDSNPNAVSRVRISDGRFDEKDTIRMEYRPRVKISKDTGTVASSKVKGTTFDSGHKFETLLVGAGPKIIFTIYAFANGNQNEVIRQYMTELISGINSEAIQLGGQKSNGCGFFKVEKALFKAFDMRTSKDRELWKKEEKITEYEDITAKINDEHADDYVITIIGKTQGELLVKGIALSEFGNDAPDGVNIVNSNEDYIIPASSIKGAIRNQMNRVAAYMKTVDEKAIMDNTFGKNKDSDDAGKTGNIVFFDTIVGDKNSNNLMPVRNRIHIDKLTGGTISGAKFTYKNIAGKINSKIIIHNKNQAKKSCGLLILTLRDLAAGMVTLGSGVGIGKGYLDIEKILIHKEQSYAEILFKDNKINDENGLISDCLAALKEG